ncbi:MAG: hypothetical protein ABI488_02565 [Polyangiaceae bacterium]
MDQGPAPLRAWRDLLRFLALRAFGGLMAWGQHLKTRLWLLIVILIAWGVYLYFVSAGGLRHWPVYGVYLDLQADAFRAGHLYLPLAPPPELVHEQDPYDRVNIRYWALDLSYFRGRYYSYWGPLPALLQAAGKALLGIKRGLGDQYIGLFSACLTALGGALIIERMGRRMFRAVPRFVLIFGILAFAFANPTLHNVASAGTYQSAILAGQAWVVPGLLLAFDAVWHAGTSSARRYRLALAGVCWAFALASRVTVLPTVAFLIGATALAEGWVSERRWRRTITNALWLGLPVAAAGVGLLVYNKLRFGNPLEFGLNLQLSGYPRMYFARQYWWFNLYSYRLRPFATSCQFPYLYQVWWLKVKDVFPAGFSLPIGYYMTDEPLVGWLIAVPITWFMGFAFILALRPLRLRLRQARVYLWCLASFSALACLTGLTAMGVYGATMRYLNDVTPGMVLLALLGAFALRAHRFGQMLPKLTNSVVVVLSGATIVMGCLLGYQGYNGHFHKYNPELDATLVKALSICGGREPQVPRFWP